MKEEEQTKEEWRKEEQKKEEVDEDDYNENTYFEEEEDLSKKDKKAVLAGSDEVSEGKDWRRRVSLRGTG